MPDLRPFEAHSADHLRLVIETGHIGIWELDLGTGEAMRNSAHDEIFGYSQPLPEWTYDLFLSHVVAHDRERVDALQKQAIASGEEWNFDCEIRTATGASRWISAAGRPIAGANGESTAMIGHVIDITATKERETRLVLLTDELNHRVRNMLAVIKSIVRLSAPRAKDIPTLVKSLEGRVAALARSHDLLVSDMSTPLTPSAIMTSELQAFPDLGDRFYVTSTTDQSLGSAAAQGLALVLHELITNALKYGALSNAAGHVKLSIEEDGADVMILWRERGGPPVEDRTRSGFGSALIAGALGSAGEVDIRYPSAGVECDIRLHIRR